MNVISFKSVWKAYVDAWDLRDRGIGYVAAGGTNVAPSATGAGSLGVTVAASTGVGIIVNSATTFTTYAGGAITLTAADATNPRVDIVYFSSAGALAKTDGTPAAIVPGVSGPVPPAWPAGCCPIAICLVPSTATDFTTGGYVMDVRCFNSVPTGTASSTSFRRGDNQWAVPPSATATTAGYVPTPPNNTTTFLRGDATFATPAGASGGTPALVLGTANAAGVATTFIRDDDTILAFDATLPAADGIPAVGVATTTPRRDHVHANQLFSPNFIVFQMPQTAGVTGGGTTVVVPIGAVGSGNVLAQANSGPGCRMTTGATNGSLAATTVPFDNAGAVGLSWAKFLFARWYAYTGVLTQSKYHLYLSAEAYTTPPVATVRHIGFRVVNVGAAANWFATNADGTTETSTDTTILADGANHQFAVTFDGTSLRYYIDNVLRATQTTNIPTGNTMYGLKAVAENTAAADSRIYVGEMLAAVSV